MQGTIQLIQISPDELQSRIIDGVKAQIDSLKSEFRPKQPTEYLTRNEVRDLLQVNLSTVHNLTKRGTLRAYGIGGRVYYKRDEVEAAIQPLK
ncbi:helix-turn-helix domain-containing protein [uncultured Draconibacterium sp.]|uniref:helix-turn-helix domain-containing protein n=1 Tax=uncultured Draconibacterium sp. TaxID=1573823 RepID=UPI003217A300